MHKQYWHQKTMAIQAGQLHFQPSATRMADPSPVVDPATTTKLTRLVKHCNSKLRIWYLMYNVVDNCIALNISLPDCFYIMVEENKKIKLVAAKSIYAYYNFYIFLIMNSYIYFKICDKKTVVKRYFLANSILHLRRSLCTCYFSHAMYLENNGK